MDCSFKYEIGNDCWMVLAGEGQKLYRVQVVARTYTEREHTSITQYIVKVDGEAYETTCSEVDLYDMKTENHKCLCRLEQMMSF